MTVIVEALVYLYLLGYLPNGLRSKRESWLVDTAITLCQGMLLNYFILLLAQRLTTALELGAGLGAIGALFFARDLLKGRLAKMKARPAAIAALACVAALIFTKVLAEPVWDWDALAMWFFHAKMMYTSGTLGAAAGWQLPSLYQTEPSYPKMVTSLAAELCHCAGFWNLYLPKGAIAILLTPAFLLLFSFFEWSLSFLALLAFLTIGLHMLLWSGYMDGFVGLFGSLCLLLFSRYRSEGRKEDLYAAIFALGIAANVKNEGLLLAVCVSAVFTLFDLRSLRRSDPLKVALTAAAVVAPALIWKVFVTRFGLHDDKFDFGAVGPLQRFIANMKNGHSFWFVTKSLYPVNHPVRDSSLVLLVAFLWARMFGLGISKEIKRSVLANLVCAGAYSLGLFFSYMILTKDQADVVMTSVGRTTFLTASILNISIYLVARELEFGEQKGNTCLPLKFSAKNPC